MQVSVKSTLPQKNVPHICRISTIGRTPWNGPKHESLATFERYIRDFVVVVIAVQRDIYRCTHAYIQHALVLQMSALPPVLAVVSVSHGENRFI